MAFDFMVRLSGTYWEDIIKTGLEKEKKKNKNSSLVVGYLWSFANSPFAFDEVT